MLKCWNNGTIIYYVLYEINESTVQAEIQSLLPNDMKLVANGAALQLPPAATHKNIAENQFSEQRGIFSNKCQV